MSSVVTPQRTVTYTVPKATGTSGDTLVAWGLAIFVAEVLHDSRVILSDQGQQYLIETSVRAEAFDERLAAYTWEERLSLSRLLWLASEDKGRLPKSGSLFEQPDLTVDRDQLREAHQLWRANQKAVGNPSGGDAPAITTGKDPQLYTFYEVLTNPGTQWAGYDSFVEHLYGYLTTQQGVQAILSFYASDASAATGKPTTKVLYLNPPGFLYPGMNKGPTMRVNEAAGTTVGSATTPDWMLIDRGDRPLFEIYLAYVGYFRVARIVTTKEQRVVALPIPARVQVPRILGWLPGRELEATNLTDYLAAQNALDYALAALQYQADLQGDAGNALERRGVALRGAHLSVFWRPNGNVFAPSRLTRISLPIWFQALLEQEVDLARNTVTEHKKRLAAVRGRWRDEKKLPAEQRWAIEAYLRSLNGGLRDWFLAVAAWFPAARAASNIGWNIGLWSIEEIRRIAAAMSKDEQEIMNVLNDEAFERLASAIRLSTVTPHINRERRKRGETADAYPYRVNYDLTASLLSAAERGPKDFLREFYSFAGRYNDETARPNVIGRPLLRTNDLAQLAEWMRDRTLQTLIPYALVAFGTSLKRKAGAGDVDTSNPDTGTTDGDSGGDGDGGAEE